MRDIILVLSDQHSALTSADTPFLDSLAEQSLCFDHAYCPSPLCVPSRMSFLSGRLPHDLHIFNNDTTLGIDVPTMAHAMGAKGYHTILIGRMHFKGDDQKHGFDERIGLDITSQYWGDYPDKKVEYGDYAGTTNMKNCQRVVGGGFSPVLAYDDEILRLASAKLKEKHEQPWFVVIGFYGPHFPYVCDEKLYQKYKNRFTPDERCYEKADAVYQHLQQPSDPEHVRNIKASYCGMVEMLDRRISELYEIIKKYAHDPVFIYTSDHGEQAGKRSLYGKQTLYEEAIRVPLMIHGKGFPCVHRLDPVSLLDLNKTILDLAGAALPNACGTSLLENDHIVKVEQILKVNDELILLEAVIKDQVKLLSLGDEIKCYNLEDEEITIDECLKNELMSVLLDDDQKKQCLNIEARQRLDHKLLKEWGSKKQPVETQRFKIPEAARKGAHE